jgi:hypothetical protein
MLFAVTFESFNYADACASPKQYAKLQDPPSEIAQQWLDGVPRIALHQAVHPTVKTSCADKNGRDRASSYIHKIGELCGIIKLVTGWHPIGHCVCTILVFIAFTPIEISVYSMKMK